MPLAGRAVLSNLKGIALAAAGIVLAYKALAVKRPYQPRSIYLLGDSHTAAPYYRLADKKFFDSERTWFQKAIQKRVKAPVYVGARGGWGTKKAKEYFMPDIKAKNPDVVVAWLGTNDVASARSEDHIVEQLQSIKKQVAPAKLVVIEILDWGGYKNGWKYIEKTDRINNAIRAKVGVPTIRTDRFGAGGKLKPEYSSDNLHFERPAKSVAYDLLAEMVVDTIMAL